MEPNYTTESPIRSSLDSTAQTGHANGADWQEVTYQKIKTMKDLYMPVISEMYQKIAAKLQQHDSLPQQSKSDQLEKLKVFKTMLERIITFLQVSKSNIPPGYNDNLGSYEEQIANFINTNRPKKPALQQGQFLRLICNPCNSHNLNLLKCSLRQDMQMGLIGKRRSIKGSNP